MDIPARQKEGAPLQQSSCPLVQESAPLQKNSQQLGWVVVDKPEHATSMRMTHLIKKTLGLKKAGHAGTLDPLATGLLPIALNRTTWLIPYLMDWRKTYDFTLRWGQATTTDDSLGVVLKENPSRPSLEDIVCQIPHFLGKITQVPPAFSALKIQGQPAYSKARLGETFSIPSRQITIESLILLENTLETASFRVVCSSGTYVRSLGRDLAEACGTLGHISRLRRLQVGPWEISPWAGFPPLNHPDAQKIQPLNPGELSALGPSFGKNIPENAPFILPPEAVLSSFPQFYFSSEEISALWHGRTISLPKEINIGKKEGNDGENPLQKEVIACYDMSSRLVALAKVCQGWLAPIRCFVEKL